MGLFDWISTPLTCPYCGTPSAEWQTKDLDPTLTGYTLEEFKAELLKKPHGRATSVNGEIHHICEQCKAYISLLVEARDEANWEAAMQEFRKTHPALSAQSRQERPAP